MEQTTVYAHLPEGIELEYAKPGDAGMDLRSAEESFVLTPGEIRRVKTGVNLAIPEGLFGMVVPRSGNASRGLGVANSPGIVDSGYRGDVSVLLYNLTLDKEIHVSFNDRIAQIVFVPYATVSVHATPLPLPSSLRGESGFGSTGVS